MANVAWAQTEAKQVNMLMKYIKLDLEMALLKCIIEIHYIFTKMDH